MHPLTTAHSGTVGAPDGPIDLLADEDDLDRWIELESDHLPLATAGRGHLVELRELRGLMGRCLRTAAAGSGRDAADRQTLNAHSAASPWHLELTGRDELTEVASGQVFEALCATIVRSAMEIVATPSAHGIRVCEAPSCGMFFLQDSPRQAWCTPACGNRARIARHAARRRAAAKP